MNKDQIALYLNEHPEFFNDYPELLQKIKKLEETELPQKPKTLVSLADRIFKRVHEDKNDLKDKLAWLIDVLRTNETTQEHFFQMEREILTSPSMGRMFRRLRDDLINRFEIPFVRFLLVENESGLRPSDFAEEFPENLDKTVGTVDVERLPQWFDKEDPKPVLRGKIQGESEWFHREEAVGEIRSEVLIPVVIKGAPVFLLALGSGEPYRFHAGLRTEFLERMAEKIAIAMEHILRVETLQNQIQEEGSPDPHPAPSLHTDVPRELRRAGGAT